MIGLFIPKEPSASVTKVMADALIGGLDNPPYLECFMTGNILAVAILKKRS